MCLDELQLKIVVGSYFSNLYLDSKVISEFHGVKVERT